MKKKIRQKRRMKTERKMKKRKDENDKTSEENVEEDGEVHFKYIYAEKTVLSYFPSLLFDSEQICVAHVSDDSINFFAPLITGGPLDSVVGTHLEMKMKKKKRDRERERERT
jgi:hypothetical protein